VLTSHPESEVCEQSLTDPCMSYKSDDSGKVELITARHVDDNFYVGTEKARHWCRDMTGERLSHTREGEIGKLLGVCYEKKVDDEGNVYLEARMPKLVRGIIGEYEKHIGKEAKEFDSPGTPGETLTKNEGEPKGPEVHRSIVGKCVHLVTRLFAGGCDSARGLSRHFSNPGEGHWKGLGRAVGHLKKTEGGVKLALRRPLQSASGAASDSNYATSTIDRRSVSGGLTVLGGMICNWMSKTRPTVALSSTEAEYGGSGTNAQGLLFMDSVLDELGVREGPAILLVGNEGAIFLVRNQATSQRARHIDVKAHSLREHYLKGDFDVSYVPTKDNDAGDGTKDLPVNECQEASKNLRNGAPFICRKWGVCQDQIEEKRMKKGGD